MTEVSKYTGKTISGLEEWLGEYTPLRYFGDEHLLRPTEKVGGDLFGTQELERMAEELIRVHRDIRQGTGGGTGLAFNQIGGQYSIATVWTRGLESPLLMCNPVIIGSIGNAAMYESCLSGIGSTGEVRRPEVVTISYRDIEGRELTAGGDPSDNGRRFSRVAQHEADHLLGITCDRLFEPGTELLITDLDQFGQEPFSRGILSLPD